MSLRGGHQSAVESVSRAESGELALEKTHKPSEGVQAERRRVTLLFAVMMVLLLTASFVVLRWTRQYGRHAVHISHHHTHLVNGSADGADATLNGSSGSLPTLPTGVERYFWHRDRAFVVKRHGSLKEKDTVLLCGAVHYFRVPRDSWADRLRKARAAGLNCVETYVPWNFHEQRRGLFRFDGQRDIEHFLALAETERLFVVLRPGPYVCAEWSGGGLPSWLLADPHMSLRSTYEPFIAAVTDWFWELMPRIGPHLYHRGGSVVLVQIENEYGNYGFDHDYMWTLHDMLGERGIDCLLFTADGAHVDSQLSGGLDGVLRSTTLRKNADQAFRELRTVQRWGPLFASEVWVGWFDSWLSTEHNIRPIDQVVQTVTDILRKGASFSLYMFAGGSNGVRNGALVNSRGKYRAHTSSYDYDAPINEAGDLTPKFYAIRDAIARVYPDAVEDLAAFGELRNASIVVPEPIVATNTASFLTWAMMQRLLARDDAAPGMVERSTATLHGDYFSDRPLMFESVELAVDSGFVLYRTVLHIEATRARIKIVGLRDRAFVLLDGRLVGVDMRDDSGTHDDHIFIDVPAQGNVLLEILVENLGRINYGADLHDRKGIQEYVQVGRHHVVHGWKHVPIELEDLPQPSSIEPLWRPRDSGARVPQQTEPTLYLFELYASNAEHSMYLSMAGWGSGYVWINGKLLSRYWTTAGPQETIFIPNSMLRVGGNDIVVLELLGAPSDATVRFAAEAKLGIATVTPDW
jgi:beta-galactosidase